MRTRALPMIHTKLARNFEIVTLITFLNINDTDDN